MPGGHRCPIGGVQARWPQGRGEGRFGGYNEFGSGRLSQVVRQRSAKPRSRVQFPESPPADLTSGRWPKILARRDRCRCWCQFRCQCASTGSTASEHRKRLHFGQYSHLARDHGLRVRFDGRSADLGPVGFGAALRPLAGQMEPGQFGQVFTSMGEGLLAADSVDHPPQPRAERAASCPSRGYWELSYQLDLSRGPRSMPAPFRFLGHPSSRDRAACRGQRETLSINMGGTNTERGSILAAVLRSEGGLGPNSAAVTGGPQRARATDPAPVTCVLES